MVQSTLSPTSLIQRLLEPGTDSNTHFGCPYRYANSASGSVLIAPQSFGVYAEMPLLHHSGLFIMSKMQCNTLTLEYGGPLGIQGLKETRLQTN